jgi:hypothetical protein
VNLGYAGGVPANILSYLKRVPVEYRQGAISIDFEINVTLNSGSPTSTFLRVSLLDSSLNQLGASQDINTGITTHSVFTTLDFTTAKDIFYIQLQGGLASTAASSITVLVDAMSVQGDEYRSETKQFDINCGCSNQEVRIQWLNNLGAFESPWSFTGETEHTVDITEAGETTQNIFPSWPNSYGEYADTIDKQTYRKSYNRKFIFSQFLTQDQADAISFIKSSPVVQIVNSRTDRRTVIVDTDSFTKYKDGDKTYTVQFNILYTDEIPSQTI